MKTHLKKIQSIAALFCLTCANTDIDHEVCEPQSYKCSGTVALQCTSDGTGWQVIDDCDKKELTCTSKGCLFCEPNSLICQAEKLMRCNSDGEGFLPEPELICNAEKGEICNDATCVNACELAKANRSYVGCEYWAVDLDNAVVDTGNAAAQQFAVVLSNPSALSAKVIVSVNDAPIGQSPQIREITTKIVKPQALEILHLDAREVDGSPLGEFNTGTGTALTNNAYKIESNVPLVVYQFNPLSNVGVFSNDASLLIPTAALTIDASTSRGDSYLVMGWPQTIAITEDPNTNFGTDLRAFLTIVGTRDETNIRILPNTSIISDGPLGQIPALKKDEEFLFTINAYEVLNLETSGFGPNADFTGTYIDADKPVVVFSGSEASDVPDPPDLTYRRCCADHLEEQLFPISTLGRTFIALTTPSRTVALQEAGANIIGQPKEKEYFRVLASEEFTSVTTNLPKPYDNLSIARKQFIRLEVDQDFTIHADGAIVVGQFVSGQQDVGIPKTLPGGDPSFILLPPIEQFRKNYLFLTPDKYSFDFILVAAPKDAQVKLDNRILADGCDESTGTKICCSTNEVGTVRIPGDSQDTDFVAYKCQLSFPNIIEGAVPPDNLEPGIQNDGVHSLTSQQPIGLVVYGFDAYVSYGYPGGTDLALINIQ